MFNQTQKRVEYNESSDSGSEYSFSAEITDTERLVEELNRQRERGNEILSAHVALCEILEDLSHSKGDSDLSRVAQMSALAVMVIGCNYGDIQGEMADNFRAKWDKAVGKVVSKVLDQAEVDNELSWQKGPTAE